MWRAFASPNSFMYHSTIGCRMGGTTVSASQSLSLFTGSFSRCNWRMMQAAPVRLAPLPRQARRVQPQSNIANSSSEDIEAQFARHGRRTSRIPPSRCACQHGKHHSPIGPWRCHHRRSPEHPSQAECRSHGHHHPVGRHNRHLWCENTQFLDTEKFWG